MRRAVARLKAAGAIVFGKTNVPRWSGDLQTYNEIFGTTNNPWDVTGCPAVVGWAGRRRRLRVHQLRARHRHRRVDPHPVALLRRVRPEAELRRRLRSAATSTTSAAAPPTPTSTCSGRSPAARDDLDLLLGVLAGPDADRAAAWRLDLPPSTRRRSQPDARVAVWLDEASYPIDARVPSGARPRRRAHRRGGCTGRGGPPADRLDRAGGAVHADDQQRHLAEHGSSGRRAHGRVAPRVARVGRSSGRRSGRGGRSGSTTRTSCSAR